MTATAILSSRSGYTRMTEAEWFTCRIPTLLLEIIEQRSSPRKLLLFLVACYRSLRQLMLLPHFGRLAEATESFADGEISEEEWAGCLQEAQREALSLRDVSDLIKPCWRYPLSSAASLSQLLARQAKFFAQGGEGRPEPFVGTYTFDGEIYERERAVQAELLRDLFANPFRPSPTVSSAWLTWDSELVVRLARGAYAERDFERLPILADALEDAGCDSTDLLSHLRGPGPHVRGCWVVDLILGKH
jgi:hypothetical protein